MGWLRRFLGRQDPKPSLRSAVPPLHFKDPDAALEFACQFLRCEWRDGARLPAVIDDVTEVPGMGPTAIVRVAATGSPRPGLAVFPNKHEPLGGVLWLRELCLVEIGPEIAAPMRPMLVAGILQTTFEHPLGWVYKKSFAPQQ